MHFAIAILVWAGLLVWVIRSSSGLRSTVALRALLRSWVQRTRLGGRTRYVILAAVLALVGIGLVRTGMLDLGTGPDRRLILPPVAERLPPTPTAGLGRGQVRLMADTELRTGPSPYVPALRQARQNDVFTEFARANGWSQVGVGRPEGWVAGAVVDSVR